MKFLKFTAEKRLWNQNEEEIDTSSLIHFVDGCVNGIYY
jgi:hypothetical protein